MKIKAKTTKQYRVTFKAFDTVNGNICERDFGTKWYDSRDEAETHVGRCEREASDIKTVKIVSRSAPHLAKMRKAFFVEQEARR